MRPDPDLAQDPRLEAHLTTLRGRLSPTAIALAQRTARSLDWRALGSPQDPQWTSRLFGHVRARLAPGVRIVGVQSDADIEALAFLVLMEAAKSTREDLKAIMDGVKSINEAKEKMRDLLLVMVARAQGRAVEWPPR